MDQALLVSIDLAYAICSLLLVSSGLALIFGLMRVINLAHGEFVVLGGYTTIVAMQHGVPIWIAMFVLAPLAVGLFGLLVERVLIRWLYGRMVDTMLATWGLSLLIAGGISTVFGTTTTGVSNPLPAVSVGDYQASGYSLFVIAVAVLVAASLFAVLRWTRAGLIARAAMQSADVVAALGYNPSRIYMITFTMGSALSGLAGGVLAPLTGLTPTSGTQYVAKAFITVISGGASVVAGSAAASTLFATVAKGVEAISTPVVGEIALLVCALVLLRLLPQGITGRWFRRSV